MAYTGSVPDTGARRRDWMESMACRDVDPDTFSDPASEHEARLICIVRCPVRRQCLASVQETEAGASRGQRDGVIAGLTDSERWRLDTAAYRCKTDSPPLVFDGEPPACGTYNAMLRHLSRGERIDPECWSAEVRRNRLSRVSLAVKRSEAIAEAS